METIAADRRRPESPRWVHWAEAEPQIATPCCTAQLTVESKDFLESRIKMAASKKKHFRLQMTSLEPDSGSLSLIVVQCEGVELWRPSLCGAAVESTWFKVSAVSPGKPHPPQPLVLWSLLTVALLRAGLNQTHRLRGRFCRVGRFL